MDDEGSYCRSCPGFGGRRLWLGNHLDPLSRFRIMPVIKLRIVSWTFLCVAVAVGCGSPARPIDTISPSDVPSVVASPTITQTTAPTPTPLSTTLGPGERALNAGIYRLDLNVLAAGGAEYPPMLITVPSDWNSSNGSMLNRAWPRERTVGVQFWAVDQVYGHACQWRGTLLRPGPTVEDLTQALVDRPLRNATPPIDVTLDGYVGQYLEWSVPADIDFSDCDSDGGVHLFESWTGPASGWATNRYQLGPGQVDRLWILDINGARLVIDAFQMPSSVSEEREALSNLVESIRFQR